MSTTAQDPRPRRRKRRYRRRKSDPGTLVNARQARFMELYVSGPAGIRFNATRAAEAAGYAWPAKQGPRLLSFPGIAWQVAAMFKLRHQVARWPNGLAKRLPKVMRLFGRPMLVSVSYHEFPWNQGLLWETLTNDQPPAAARENPTFSYMQVDRNRTAEATQPPTPEVDRYAIRAV